MPHAPAGAITLGFDTVIPGIFVMFGPSSGNVVVTEASLDYVVGVEGQGITLHQITTSADINIDTVTYNTLDGTLINSGNEAYNTTAMGTWLGADTFTGAINIPVSASVIQSFIRGDNTAQPGWFGIGSHPTDGQQLSSVDTPEIADRPQLNVTYTLEA